MLELSKKSTFYKTVSPSIGFCERAEIFTGKNSLDLGLLTAINISNESPYKYLKYINKIFYYFFIIFNFSYFKKIYRRIIWEYSKIINKPMHPQNIPLNKLHLFNLTEDKYKYSDLNNYEIETIFDLSRKKNILINSNVFTSLNFKKNYSDDQRIKMMLNQVNNYDISLLYISEADSIGHLHGPNSSNIKQTCKNIDNKIKDIYFDLNKKLTNFELLILGDHGMEEIYYQHDVVNILKKIFNKNKLQLFKEIEIFVDSTILRLWIKNKNNLELIKKIMQDDDFFKNNGKFIQSTNFGNQNKIIENYGDIIWWINKNNLISPSFFSNNSIILKGMHGYYDKNLSSGFGIYFNSKSQISKIIDNIKLSQTFSHFLKFINTYD